MWQRLMLVAITLIVIGIVLLAIALIASVKQPNVEVGFGGFIGPFPFGFFSSKKAFWLWLGLAALVALFFIIWLLTRKH